LQNNYAEEELAAKDIRRLLSDPMLKRLKVIIITGGEPFLKNDFEQILLEFQENVSPRVFHITTNGFLTDKIVASVKFLKSKGLCIEMKISIDDISHRHDALRNKEGSFQAAVETIQRLRSTFSGKELGIGINQTIYEENYSSIPEVKKLARSLRVTYRGFIGLKKRPLYTQDTRIDYGLSEFSPEAKEYIKENILETHARGRQSNNRLEFIDDLVLRHYVNGQLKMLSDDSSPRHKCMCLFTHFRMNPNGDIITCSYDLEAIGNIKEESYEAILNKKAAREKLKKIKECGKCWLGCEVSPNWVSSLFMF
jgi:MoaA/NifB/PqqE/SkfB family radical SAM enzyme